MPTTNHTMAFYAATLVHQLQKTLAHGQFAVPSRDKDGPKTAIEIGILFQTGYPPAQDVKTFLLVRYEALELSCRDWESTDTRMNADLEEKQVDDLLTPATEPPAASNVNAGSAGQFMITERKLMQLRSAKGDALEKILHELRTDLNAIVNATKSGWGTVMMLICGVVALPRLSAVYKTVRVA
ncbi:hypothetical protein DICSQDRAFT_171745 [Dichomitus squalens LYAD-421 SS1]|uniref:Uncharacterized protein n=2 Tax=Dichomitus squalens TaxID=114155 RepID=A0A4Q9N4W9_9APHY|nr:uncharacterized protein DICSQDRAFT_171745 [Dichomitus squalens LYAD-421 SS1]EJF59783.1 hypothetical protein DICSQDRAFT_171745 [Dichomitus squalens LYAD-421 SS1]TBU34302.1 hypothetical protein BD311DRAFT_802635 [Dichomitus squalens]